MSVQTIFPVGFFPLGFFPDQSTVTIPESFEVAVCRYLFAETEVKFWLLQIPSKEPRTNVRGVVTPISGSYDRVLRGASGLTYSTLQIDIYAPTYEAVAIAETQVRYALQDYSGLIGVYDVENAILVNKPSNFTATTNADTGTWRRTVEYEFAYISDIPNQPVQIPSPETTYGSSIFTKGFKLNG